MPDYLCGDEGYVDVGGTRLDVTEWSAEEVAEWAETTNTGSSGYKESIVCKKYMTGTVTADFSATLGPKSAPDFDAGDQVAMELHTNNSGNYTLTANITRLRWTNPAGNKVSYTFDFESNGSYSYA